MEPGDEIKQLAVEYRQGLREPEQEVSDWYRYQECLLIDEMARGDGEEAARHLDSLTREQLYQMLRDAVDESDRWSRACEAAVQAMSDMGLIP